MALVSSICLGLALVEVGLRVLLGPPACYRYPQEWYQYDSAVGHWLVPGQRTFTHDKPVQTNSNGFRDREYQRTPPPGVRRIVALGDSQTYGEGVALGDSWPKRLEQELVDKGESSWEVINAGISGTDTWQHERILTRVIESYAFDVAILALYVNDVSPVYAPAPPQERTNSLKKRASYLLRRSATVSLLWALYRSRFISADSARRERNILTGDHDPTVEGGWKQVRASLIAMRDMCEREACSALVVILPRRDQVSGVTTSAAYQDRALQLCRELEVPAIDVLPELREGWRIYGSALFIPWDGHNGPIGNRIIARRVADWLTATSASVKERVDP